MTNIEARGWYELIGFHGHACYGTYALFRDKDGRVFASFHCPHDQYSADGKGFAELVHKAEENGELSEWKNDHHQRTT